MVSIQNLKGTRDFYPSEQRVIDRIFSVWTHVCKKYNFEAYEGPILEQAKMWQLKSGAEIPDQMYAFEDKGGQMIALRPEMTPSLARMVAQKQKELSKPMKWFCIPRCFRYEAPQKGRLREFFQLNVDTLGSTKMSADAEIIMTVIDILKEFRITPEMAYIRLGNRKLIEALIVASGVPATKYKDVSRIIDKKDKLSQTDYELTLKDLGLDDATIQKLDATLAIENLEEIDASMLPEAAQLALENFKELISLFEAYGASEWVKVDFSIMRGFDYYTSTVFEAFDRSKKFRAIAGGGRYDDLVSDFGGEQCPGVGYGFGDVVLAEFLKDRGLLDEVKQSVDYYVAKVSKDTDVEKTAVKIANCLRRKGNTVELDITERQFGKQMKYADSIGAKQVVIVGPRDLAEGAVTIKNLSSGEEVKKKISYLC